MLKDEIYKKINLQKRPKKRSKLTCLHLQNP